MATCGPGSVEIIGAPDPDRSVDALLRPDGLVEIARQVLRRAIQGHTRRDLVLAREVRPNVIEPRTREDRGSLPGRQQICLVGDVLQRRPLDSAPRQHCADRKHQADREHDHEYGRHEQVRPQRAAPSCITCSGWR